MFKEFGLAFQANGTTLVVTNLTGGDCNTKGLRNMLTLSNGEFLKGVLRAGFEKLSCYPNGPTVDVP